MASFEEFARYLLQLRSELIRFEEEKIGQGLVRLPLDWEKRFKASLGVITNILNDLENLAPESGNLSEIMERVKNRLNKLEEHIKALTAFDYAGIGLVARVARLKTMADDLENRIINRLRQQQRQGTALSKYLILKFILERL